MDTHANSGPWRTFHQKKQGPWSVCITFLTTWWNDFFHYCVFRPWIELPTFVLVLSTYLKRSLTHCSVYRQDMWAAVPGERYKKRKQESYVQALLYVCSVQWLMKHRFLKRGFKILLPYKDRHSYTSLLWRGKLWINNLPLPCWRSYVASLLFIGGLERKLWYFLSLSWTTQKASYGFLLSYFIEWVRAFLFYKGNITLLRKYFLSEFIPLLLSHIQYQ